MLLRVVRISRVTRRAGGMASAVINTLKHHTNGVTALALDLSIFRSRVHSYKLTIEQLHESRT